MRLMDQVCHADEPIVIEDTSSGALHHLPGTDRLAPALESCPLRFVLTDEIAQTCARLGFEDDTILGTSVDVLRCPAPLLWIECRGAARHGVFAGAERIADNANASDPQRLGYLIESDPAGRRGRIQCCWDAGDGLSPDVAPYVIEFDFNETHGLSGATPAIGDREWTGAYLRIQDFPALQPLFNHVRVRFREEWLDYYRQACADRDEYVRTLEAAMKPACEDVPFFAAFALLLMANNSTRTRNIEFAKLNRARAAKGRPPLLDHMEMMLELGHAYEFDAAQESAERSQARLHLVRGHLVRRGDTIYWRNAHMRGNAAHGSVQRRTVSVHLAAE